jgi:hypothetical protein
MTSRLSPPVQVAPPGGGATPNPDLTPAAMLGGGARRETSSPAPSGGLRLLPIMAHGRRCVAVIAEPRTLSDLKLMSRVASLAAATWGER